MILTDKLSNKFYKETTTKKKLICRLILLFSLYFNNISNFNSHTLN